LYRSLISGLFIVSLVSHGLMPRTTSAQETGSLQLLTLPAGSMAYRVGVTLAATLTRTTPYKTIVAGYGGAQVMIPMLDSGRAELALLNANDAGQGFRGEATFRQTNTNLRLISNAYANTVGVIVARDSAIKTIADIRGKRVTGVFSSHKSCEQLAEAQMANMGLTRADVRIVPVSTPVASVEALSEGRADVALCATPGMPAILEAGAKNGIRYLGLDPSAEAVQRLQKVFAAGTISLQKKGSIPDLTEDTWLLGYDYYLVGSTHLSEAAVKQILTVLWDEHDSLVRENREFETWSTDRMAINAGTIPYHNAAIEFFKSKGIHLP
jgi:TRAP transporter TAXI family solute receptor